MAIDVGKIEIILEVLPLEAMMGGLDGAVIKKFSVTSMLVPAQV